jgi:AcrR family transcriptional regulator
VRTTSLDAIAEEAGFRRGAVYYNFADKEDLFLELLDRRCAERSQDLRRVFADTADDAHHMLHGPRAVPQDLFSKTLSLLVDGIAARAGATPQATEGAAG